jgi:hypothetical protein
VHTRTQHTSTRAYECLQPDRSLSLLCRHQAGEVYRHQHHLGAQHQGKAERLASAAPRCCVALQVDTWRYQSLIFSPHTGSMLSHYR